MQRLVKYTWWGEGRLEEEELNEEIQLHSRFDFILKTDSSLNFEVQPNQYSCMLKLNSAIHRLNICKERLCMASQHYLSGSISLIILIWIDLTSHPCIEQDQYRTQFFKQYTLLWPVQYSKWDTHLYCSKYNYKLFLLKCCSIWCPRSKHIHVTVLLFETQHTRVPGVGRLNLSYRGKVNMVTESILIFHIILESSILTL